MHWKIRLDDWIFILCQLMWWQYLSTYIWQNLGLTRPGISKWNCDKVGTAPEAGLNGMGSSEEVIWLDGIALGKGREVLELCSWGLDYLHFVAAVAHVFAHVRCLLMHIGCLLRQYPWPPATQVVSEKGSHVAWPQSEKVPTHGLSVKKEGVWCDLSKKGTNSWIFGEKGNDVAQPPCHFSQLGEKGRCVVQPQQGANLQIFGKNGNSVAQPQKFGKKSLFLCLPVQIKCVENPFNGLTTIPALV